MNGKPWIFLSINFMKKCIMVRTFDPICHLCYCIILKYVLFASICPFAPQQFLGSFSTVKVLVCMHCKVHVSTFTVFSQEQNELWFYSIFLGLIFKNKELLSASDFFL